jgi:predicted nucleotide-binding protein
MNVIELLQSLSTELAELPRGDEGRLDRLRRRADMVIRKVFGEKSRYLKDLGEINFYPMIAPASDDYVAYSWTSGAQQFKNLIDTMIEELTLSSPSTPETAAATTVSPAWPRVFVVHGRDEEMKQAVARVLERLGLVPVILHEQPNRGRTIIEKFTEYANTGFAVVLLSGDDFAYSQKEDPAKARPRARQNVILELGYFLGRLGRERVFTLYREVSSFEIPSDYSGVVFTALDAAGRWQFDLVRELRAAGYQLDANKIL